MYFISVVADIVLFLFPVLCGWSPIMISDRLYHAEGRVGVKCILLCETWLKAVENYLNGGPDASKCDRTRSKNSEATSIGYGLAGEDFQNTGTFIVVRTSVFAVSSEHKAHLARDAHNALWNSRRRNQLQ